MPEDSIFKAVAGIAPGRYGVGVSGGADSVALLHLLVHRRADLTLHVVHLDHQLRDKASTGDAQFVAELAQQWKLVCTIARRQELEREAGDWPANPSAKYRALRHALFRRVVAEHRLDAVLLAHHADDQAETILQRLLRGSGLAGLAGMSQRIGLPGLVILRPLLGVGREDLRGYLRAVGQAWREDASNAGNDYLRNRLRPILRQHPELSPRLVSFGAACSEMRDWVRDHAPELPDSFETAALMDQPSILATESARRWLLKRGSPPGALRPEVLARFVAMVTDAASPPRQHFPGRVLVCRRGGQMWHERNP